MSRRHFARQLSTLVILAGIAALPLKPQAASNQSVSGQQLFSSTCSACHGLDGRGGEHAPNIATNAEVQRLSDKGIEQIVRNGIPGAGMPAFKSFSEEQVSAVVKYLRVLQGQSASTALLAGDPDRGRLLFFGKARCSECHMINGQGGFLGADLSGYGKAHGAAAIRDSILDPNKNADPHHAFVTVTTRAGKKYSGVIRNEDNFSLQMQTPDGSFHSFDKSELVQIERQPRSVMPSDYGKTFTSSEINDLISFLIKAPGVQATEAERDDE